MKQLLASNMARLPDGRWSFSSTSRETSATGSACFMAGAPNFSLQSSNCASINFGPSLPGGFARYENARLHDGLSYPGLFASGSLGPMKAGSFATKHGVKRRISLSDPGLTEAARPPKTGMPRGNP